MGIYNELKELEELRNNGTISEEDFESAKKRLLDPEGMSGDRQFLGLDKNTYLTLMHLSLLVAYFSIGLGIVLPVILWALNSKSNSDINRHGKNILNFIISLIVYVTVFCLLAFIAFAMSDSKESIFYGMLLAGVFIGCACGLLSVIFVVIAATKAYKGEYWRYPLSITFFR